MTPDELDIASAVRSILRNPLVKAALRDVIAEVAGVSKPAQAEGYLTVAQAAERAGVRAATVRGWIVGATNRKTGEVRKPVLAATKLPGGRDWRVKPADLEALLVGERAGNDPVSDLGLERRSRALVEAARKGTDK